VGDWPKEGGSRLDNGKNLKNLLEGTVKPQAKGKGKSWESAIIGGEAKKRVGRIENET